MTQFWIRKAITGLLLVLLLVPAATAGAGPAVEPLNYKGLLKSISEQRGKVVVVQFFASWCQPCLKEIPEIMAMRDNYADEQLAILGVSVDDDAMQLMRLVQSTGFNYPVYHATADVSSVFQVSAIPKIMVYNRRGSLALNHTGFLPTFKLKELVDSLLE